MIKNSGILILEDDKLLANSLKGLLSDNCHRDIYLAHTLDRAYEIIDARQIDLLLADWVLPHGETSLELIEYVSQYHQQIKILMLSCKEKCSDRLTAYKTGVDAYLSKPFDWSELNYLINRLLHSYKLAENASINSNMLSIFPNDGYVQVSGSKIHLRPKEMSIFQALFLNRPRVISKQKLLDIVWPNIDEQPNYNTIEVYLRRLRQLLEPTGIHLKNKRGYGYYLLADTGNRH